MRPTELATLLFQTASNSAHSAVLDKAAPNYMKNIAHAVQLNADGLQSMATGLRATYILLEEVKGLLQRQNAQQSGRPSSPAHAPPGSVSLQTR